jgi:mono/diheme cytochrome c family protein
MSGGRTWRAATFGFLALLATVAGGCGGGGDGPAEQMTEAVPKLDPALAAHLPPGATMEMAESGRKLFVTCSVCHGLDAGGTQLGPSLRDTTRITIDGTPASIERVIREGVAEPVEFATPMPPLGGGSFDEKEIGDLVAYVYALGHAAGP